MDYRMTRQGVRDLDHPIPPGRVNVGHTERALSLLGGVALAGLGVFRRGVSGLAIGMAAAALAYRGVSGHCPGYAAAGVNTAKQF